MKAIYTTDETDYKEACFEIVHALPYFKRKRILFSLLSPFYLIIFFLIPAYTPSMIVSMMLCAFLIIYFYIFQLRLFILLKRTYNKKNKWKTENELTISSENLVIKEDNIERKIEWDNVVSITETDKNWIFYLYPNKIDFIIIKKTPSNLLKTEIPEFNDLLYSKSSEINS